MIICLFIQSAHLDLWNNIFVFVCSTLAFWLLKFCFSSLFCFVFEIQSTCIFEMFSLITFLSFFLYFLRSFVLFLFFSFKRKSINSITYRNLRGGWSLCHFKDSMAATSKHTVSYSSDRFHANAQISNWSVFLLLSPFQLFGNYSLAEENEEQIEQ